MIDFINILQNSLGYSLAIIASKILDKSCEKCKEEKTEIIQEEDLDSKSNVSNDSEETLWDPIIYDGGDHKEIQQSR
jgi:hypothetical protein